MKISKSVKQTACNGLLGVVTGGSFGLIDSINGNLDNVARCIGFSTVGVPLMLPHVKYIIDLKQDKIKKADSDDYKHVLENPGIQSAAGAAGFVGAYILGRIGGTVYKTMSGG